jgi:excisionase family DNA binding protein
MTDPDLLTVSQAANALGASTQTIRNWIQSERLQAVRIGNRFQIPAQEIERLRGLAARSGESPWEHSPDEPYEPLVRKATHAAGGNADPSNGLLGA